MTDREIFIGAPEDATIEELAAYLEEACGGDDDLRKRVEALFASDDQAGLSFLTPPRPGGEIPLITDLVGSEIGNYKLLEKIGEGGCGEVYLADQMRPVNRKVALKIIKPGMDSKQLLERFDAERQALAMMEHPNIAKFFDAGATDSGRPYFVMELVRGIPITKFCDEKNYDTRQRIEIFRDVCSAVQHAHQKGMIHRDLKPSNVLVALDGDDHRAKVIDFGIAKATQGELELGSLQTQFGHFVGTPSYVAPEQAGYAVHDVDTRADIYSLGVLLYELLTGRPPVDSEQLLAAGYDEMRRMIREHDAPKPSTKFSEISEEELRAVARARHTDPKGLSLTIRGDLDWIVLKALEKDRSRRYETANAFYADLDRYLSDQPVLASPPSATYRFQKFAKRNKGLLVAVSTVALAVIVGAGLSLWQAIRASREASRATAAEAVAEERLGVAEEALAEARLSQSRTWLEGASSAEMEGDTFTAAMLAAVPLGLHDDGGSSQLDYPLLIGPEHAEHAQLKRIVRDGSAGTRPIWSAPVTAQHESEVSALALDSKNSVMATADAGGKVKLWDLESGELKETLEAHAMRVLDLAISPNGKWVASSGLDKMVRVWNVSNGELLRELPHRHWVWSIAFTPDGASLVSGTGANLLRIWDLASGEEQVIPLGFKILSLAISPDGKTLAVGGGDSYEGPDSRIRIYDFDDEPTLRKTLEGHDPGTRAPMVRGIRALEFAPDGKTLASGGKDGTVRVWDVDTWTQRAVLEGSDFDVNRIAFSEGGEMIASGSEDGKIRVWSWLDDKVKVIEAHLGRVRGIGFTHEGGRLVSGGFDRTIRSWSMPDGAPLHEPPEHLMEVTAVATADGFIATGGVDRTVKIWDASLGKLKHTLIGHRGRITDVAISPDGATVATAGAGGAVLLWDANTGKNKSLMEVTKGSVNAVAFQAESGKLAAGCSNGSIVIWQLPNPEPVARWRSKGGAIHDLQFAKSGVLFGACHDKKARVWDVETQEEVSDFVEHLDSVLALALSNDGETLASGAADGTVKFWSVESGNETSSYQGHEGRVTSLSFSSDDHFLSSSGTDGRIRLWDPFTGIPVRTLSGPLDAVRGVAFFPNDSPGNWVLCGVGRTLRVWEVNTDRPLKTFEQHDGIARAIVPFSDGVVSGGSDDKLRFWDKESAIQDLEITSNGGQFWSLTLSPNGRLFAAGNQSGEVLLVDSITKKVVQTLEGQGPYARGLSFSPNGEELAIVDGVHLRIYDVVNDRQVSSQRMVDQKPLAVAYSPDGTKLAYGGTGGAVEIVTLESDHSVKFRHGEKTFIRDLAFDQNSKWLATAGSDSEIRIWDVASGALLHRLVGHGEQVLCVAFAPDSRTLISGAADNDIILWDLARVEPIKKMKGRALGIWDITLDSTGETFFSSEGGGLLKQWHARCHPMDLARYLTAGWCELGWREIIWKKTSDQLDRSKYFEVINASPRTEFGR